MLPVKVTQISMSNMGFVVFLKAEGDERTLPIFIGAMEAQAIAFVIEQVKPPRPLTHDLMKTLMDSLECRIKRVEICDLVDNTFFAKLLIEWNGSEIALDSRPSDAIALALRFAAPIFAEEAIIETAGILVKEERQTPATAEGQHPKPTAVEELKVKLEKAVAEERYEDAAKMRDQLKKLSGAN